MPYAATVFPFLLLPIPLFFHLTVIGPGSGLGPEEKAVMEMKMILALWV